MPKKSSSERYLRGKTIPQTIEVVAEVLAPKRGVRIIVTESGKRIQLTEKGLKDVLHNVMAAKQAKIAKASITPALKGGVKVTLGGAERGKEVRYKTVERAEKAVESFHEAPPLPPVFDRLKFRATATKAFNKTIGRK